jgi:hypothetical protein
LNHGQSQKALHESDNGSGAAKGHAKHEASADGSNHGQSQKALQESDNGSGIAKGHVKHEASADGSNHGQSQKSPQESDNGSVAAKTEGRGGPSSDNAEQAKSAVGTDLGDCFHFASGADNTSSGMYDLQKLSHGNGKAYEDGQHAVARERPEPVQDAGGIDISDARHDYSWHAHLHATHDLIV